MQYRNLSCLKLWIYNDTYKAIIRQQVELKIEISGKNLMFGFKLC